MKLTRACPVCECTEGELLHHQSLVTPDELNAQNDVDVVACARCGLGFADIQTTQVELDETYEKHSKYADTSLYSSVRSANASSDAPWDVERLYETAAYLAKNVADRSARVLDVGCATGTFLGFMGELGFKELTGLDPSPVATQTARSLHNIATITGSFTSLPASAGPFDLIALQHVLEHLADVRVAIRATDRLLADGALAYVEVPDAQRYADYLVAPVHDFNTEHINHFSLELLDRAMASEGFEAVDLGTKDVRCSLNDPYPVAYGLWRKGGEPVAIADRRDMQLVNELKRYVGASEELMRDLDARLDAALEKSDKVAIWGAGQLSMKLLHDTVLRTKGVTAIIDGSEQKQGMHVGGSPIRSPREAGEILAGPQAVPVVVTSVHHQDAIVANILSAAPGANVVTLRDVAKI